MFRSNLDKDFCREMTKKSLEKDLNKILNYYMKVYDEYYETGTRDSAFLKDLVDSLIGIIDSCIKYFESKEIKLEKSDTYDK